MLFYIILFTTNSYNNLIDKVGLLVSSLFGFFIFTKNYPHGLLIVSWVVLEKLDIKELRSIN